MVKKIFIIEIKESDNTNESLTAGQVLHAVIPVAEKVYANKMESIKVEEYYKA